MSAYVMLAISTNTTNKEGKKKKKKKKKLVAALSGDCAQKLLFDVFFFFFDVNFLKVIFHNQKIRKIHPVILSLVCWRFRCYYLDALRPESGFFFCVLSKGKYDFFFFLFCKK